MQDKNIEKRQITPQMARAMEKHGGTVPMVVRDGDGKEVFNNRDATTMAIQHVKQGGLSFWSNQPTPSDYDKLAEFHFMEYHECPLCKVKKQVYLGSQYEGQKFSDGTIGNRCSTCWGDYDLLIPSKEKQKELDFKLPFVNRYINENFKLVRAEIVNEYLEALKNKENN